MEIDTDKHRIRISNDVFKLIQPELLSVDDLVIILKEVIYHYSTFKLTRLQS